MLRMRTIPLLAADSEFADLVPARDHTVAEGLSLPVVDVPAGPVDLAEITALPGAFAGLVVEGMLLQSVHVDDHDGLRLIGPGDLVGLAPTFLSTLITETGLRATTPTRLVVFGNDFLIAARHWPRLYAHLYARAADQSDRLLAQLMICQLPRVDDRLLAVLWLLAEMWGRVTPSGTVVPVHLTHSVLGGLVGARRSTVTLALKQLTEQGSILRQSDGWLLLKAPRGVSKLRLDRPKTDPRLLPRVSFSWASAVPVREPDTDQQHRAELYRTVARLRSEHIEARRIVRDSLSQLVSAREEIAARRQDISQQRVERRRETQPAPSSG